MSSTVRAIVAGHGDFAAGAISAVAQISGRGDAFVALSNRGHGADGLDRLLRETLDATGAGVIFTDLPAGSWTIAARRVLRDRPELALVTGVNVAALLDFAFQEHLPPVEAAQHAADKGRTALAVAGASPRGP